MYGCMKRMGSLWQFCMEYTVAHGELEAMPQCAGGEMHIGQCMDWHYPPRNSQELCITHPRLTPITCMGLLLCQHIHSPGSSPGVATSSPSASLSTSELRDRLQLYNTMARAKEQFRTRTETTDDVQMYVCGVTVYDYSHIGVWGGGVIAYG